MTEKTVIVPVGTGRDVEMRAPADGSLVVLARVFRGLPKIENVDELSDEQRDRLLRNLGTLGKITDSMIVKDEDREWLEDALIDDEVSTEDVFAAIAEAMKKINGGTGPAKKAAPPVRRRRG